MLNIYEKLSRVQTDLKVGKDNFNSTNNYYYRNLEDILEKLKPLLRKNKLCQIITDEIVSIGDMYYVKAEVSLINMDNPQEKISSTSYARESLEKNNLDKSQITGSTSTYARKYALNGLYNISDTYDFDRDIKKANLDDESLKTLYKISKGHEDKAKKILKDYGYRNSLEIRKKDFENIIKDLKKEIK